MKQMYVYLLALVAGISVSCGSHDDDETTVPDPGRNVAGSVAGTYRVSQVLSSSAGAGSQVAGAMTGSGTITLTAINDSTVTYTNQTELTVTASGKKITLQEGPTTCLVEYDKAYGQIYMSQPIRAGTSLSIAQMILKNRWNVSRTKRDGYDVAIEYSR